MKKISTWDKIQALESVGFTYHAYGTLTANGKKYDYYKGDKLTAEQKQKLKNKFGEAVQFFGSRAEYAPEISGAIVGFLIGKSPAEKSKKNPSRKKYCRVRRNTQRSGRRLPRLKLAGSQYMLVVGRKRSRKARRNCGCARKRSRR